MNKSQTQVFVFFVLVIFAGYSSLNVAPTQTSAEISISWSRNFGTAPGNSIQGRFTIIGSGSDKIVRMELQLNGDTVMNVDEDSFSYKLNTKDYPVGEFTVTVIGWDADDTAYSTTQVKNILGTWINYVTILGVIGLIGVKNRKRIKNFLMAKTNSKNSTKEDEDDLSKIRVKTNVLE